MDEGSGHDRLAEQRLRIEQAGGEGADQPVPIGCAAAGEVERELEGDRPGDRSMEQLLERVLERASFDLDREHLAGGAPAREAGRPVGPEDHPRVDVATIWCDPQYARVCPAVTRLIW